MNKLKLSFFSILILLVPEVKQQNSTVPRRQGPRDSNVVAALQQIQMQLATLDAEYQRQFSKIQDLHSTVTRMEGQRQDFLSSLDRSESRISQRLDDIKGDVQKVITLQEVVREDVDKVQQQQLLNKVWLEEQLRHISARNVPETASFNTDGTTALYSNSDILSNLQILQTTVYSLRRMADTLQINTGTIKENITTLANFTRQMFMQQKEAAVTKSYLQSSLQNLASETQDHQQFVQCLTPLQNQVLDENLPRDCMEVKKKMHNKTGIYRIQPMYAPRPIFAYCEMETEGGGWTVIQRRRDGSVDFLREWNDYKHGFGNVGSEFWLGNENIYLITHQGLYEIRVDLHDFEDGHAFTKYEGFAVGSEKEKYMLKLLGPFIGGDAGDGLTYHASMPFSTIDMDNDRWEGGNCAQDHTGGWWYNQCDASNLNGQYLSGMTQNEYKGVYWHEWQGPSYSLMATRMMIRPIKRQVLHEKDTPKENEEHTTVTWWHEEKHTDDNEESSYDNEVESLANNDKKTTEDNEEKTQTNKKEKHEVSP